MFNLVTGQFAISTLFARFLPPNTSSSFAYALFTFLSGRSKVPREDEDNANQNCLRVLRDKKHAKKVYYGKCGNCECRV